MILRGRAVLIATTVAVAGAGWTGLGPSAGSPRPTQAGDDEQLSLVLQDQRFAIESGQPWTAQFTVAGAVADLIPPSTTTTTTTVAEPTGTSAPPDDRAPTVVTERAAASLRVVLHGAVTERSELAQVADGARSGVVDVLQLPLDQTLTTADGMTTLTIAAPTTIAPGAGDALTMRRPGLYPVTVEIVVGGDVVAEHLTFVERLSDEDRSAPMQLAMVAGVDDPGPAPSADELRSGRAQLAAIAETAAAVDGPITVALPPVLLDGLAADDPALSQALQSALAGDEVLALPADVLDPSSAVAVGAQDAFTRELLEGADISNTALPSAPARRSSWLVASALSTDAAVLLRGLGFGMLVLSAETYGQLEGNIGGFLDTSLAVEVDLGDDGVLPAMVRAPVGALLDADRLADTDVSPAEAAVRIMAELVTARRELGADQRRSVVLATPDLSAPDPTVAAHLTTYAGQVPQFALASLSAVPSTTDTMIIPGDGPERVTLPATAGPALRDRAARIDLTRLSAQSAGSMMRDEAQLQTWMDELDTLLSTGISDAEANATLARISAESDAVRDQVEAPRPFTFTLTGRESELRLNIRNHADEPLRVIVRARSPKLSFPTGDQLIELAPTGVTEVVIPVEARANGTSSIEIELVTPDLELGVEGPVVLTARVNALTGLGQVITGGAVLVLLSWWYGHFRRRRRLRLARLEATEAPRAFESVSPDAAEAAAVPHAEEPSSTSLADP